MNLKTLLGIAYHKISHVSYLWSLRCLYQIGALTSWTVIYALFIDKFGFHYLPGFLMLDAVFIIVGSLLAHYIFIKTSLDRFIFGSILGCIFFVLIAFYWNENLYAFLFFALIAKNFFFFQLNISIFRKNESLFSPREAQSAMPVIDSGITIGIVLGSLIFLELLGYSTPQELILFWVIPLIAMGLLIILEPYILRKSPCFSFIKNKNAIQISSQSDTKEALKVIQKTPFLRMFCVFVFLQAAIFSIIELKFLEEVEEESVFMENEMLSLYHEEDPAKKMKILHHLKGNLLEEYTKELHKLGSSIEEKTKSLSGRIFINNSIAHHLGVLNLIFGITALVVQLFLTSRVLRKFGIIYSIVLYLGGLLSVVLGFLFLGVPINLVRGYEHGFHSIFMSAYHLSFYSIFSNFRENIRHILEGIIRPFGIVVAMGCIMLLSCFFEASQFYQIFWGVLFVSILAILWLMKKAFTELSYENFTQKISNYACFHAIETLSQKGHKNAINLLCKEIKNKSHSEIIREKIITSLTEINNPEIIHTYMEILENTNESYKIKTLALQSLLSISRLKKYWKEHSFSQYRFIEILENIFYNTTNKHLQKLALMNLFQHLPSHKVVPFFSKLIRDEDHNIQSICLRSSSEIFNDPSIGHYIGKMIHTNNSFLQGYVVIALWNYYDKKKLREINHNKLDSGNQELQISALYTIGEVMDNKMLIEVEKFTNDSRVEVRLHANIACLKLKNKNHISKLVSLLLSEDIHISQKASQMLKRVPLGIRERIKKELESAIGHRVVSIITLGQHGRVKESLLRPKDKKYIYHLYNIADHYDDNLLLD